MYDVSTTFSWTQTKSFPKNRQISEALTTNTSIVLHHSKGQETHHMQSIVISIRSTFITSRAQLEYMSRMQIQSIVHNICRCTLIVSTICRKVMDNAQMWPIMHILRRQINDHVKWTFRTTEWLLLKIHNLNIQRCKGTKRVIAR